MPAAPVIVLTGGIASGKSTVAKLLAAAGGRVISADSLAREVLLPGQAAWKEVVSAWGQGVLTSTGEIDRVKLGRLVFTDPAARRRLEKITHPRIFDLMHQQMVEAQKSAAFVVLEIPLYFETECSVPADEVWVVYVGPLTQLKRLQERSGLTHEEASARVAAQLPLEKKCAWADRVIDNSKSLAITEKTVKTALQDLLASKKACKDEERAE
ncbi:MAG: dephospho-CoA kinase [Firmicutes bacterium]|nr:dephospho-CoA kinase [Bacillota bacterium]